MIWHWLALNHVIKIYPDRWRKKRNWFRSSHQAHVSWCIAFFFAMSESVLMDVYCCFCGWSINVFHSSFIFVTLIPILSICVHLCVVEYRHVQTITVRSETPKVRCSALQCRIYYNTLIIHSFIFSHLGRRKSWCFWFI